MKAAVFDYVRPETIDEVCALLAADEDARVIAGGQTLVPMMAMRLARPSRLVDIHRLGALAGIAADGDAVVIGATTRQAAALESALVGRDVPLLAMALPWVGHPPTRNRGTVGGSIAHADPSAEIPLVAVTLGADIEMRDAAGVRTMRADEFFLGSMMTAIPPATCLTSIRFPVWRKGRIGVGFHEVSARQGDFAYVAAAAQVALAADGTCLACAVGIGGASDRPVRLAHAVALEGTRLADADIRGALQEDIDALDIMTDSHASPGYRRRVAAELAARAVSEARDAASGGRHAH